jgi:hemolysin III
MADRLFTVGEEIANTSLHGLGLLLSIAGTVFLVVSATRRGDAKQMISVSIFGAALILVYSASTLYHGLPVSREKWIFGLIDNAAIYLLIAGTYTPFTLGLLRGGWGWSLLGIEWGLSIIGVLMVLFIHPRIGWLPLALYLSMGWLFLIALRPLHACLSSKGLILLGAGGVAYTVGVFFYIYDDLAYYHAIWHVLVLAGSICHFFAVLLHAIPCPVSFDGDKGRCRLEAVAVDPSVMREKGLRLLQGRIRTDDRNHKNSVETFWL